MRKREYHFSHRAYYSTGLLNILSDKKIIFILFEFDLYFLRSSWKKGLDSVIENSEIVERAFGPPFKLFLPILLCHSPFIIYHGNGTFLILKYPSLLSDPTVFPLASFSTTFTSHFFFFAPTYGTDQA